MLNDGILVDFCKNLGPLNRLQEPAHLYTDLNSGKAMVCKVKQQYKDTPLLPYVMEHVAIAYSIGKYNPFVNSPFYLKDQDYYKAARMKQIERGVRFADYVDHTVPDKQNDESPLAVLRDFSREFLEILDEAKAQKPDDYLNQAIYLASFKTKMMEGWSRDDIRVMEIISKIGNSDLYALRDGLKYPEEWFQHSFTLVEAGDILEREGDMNLSCLTENELDIFWQNIEDLPRAQKEVHYKNIGRLWGIA
ncbi:MAG: hypothetical protein JWM96_504 [Alphaproteobacteria bacterium]|nr:hypothetical protein [Alphaproteobacteria bacterium]